MSVASKMTVSFKSLWIDSNKGDERRKDMIEECYWMSNYSVEQFFGSHESK